MLDTHLLNDERRPKVRPAMESESPGLPLAPGQLDVHRLARSAHTDCGLPENHGYKSITTIVSQINITAI